MALLPAETVKRPPPLNLREGEESLFRHEEERFLSEVVLQELRDAEALPNGFLVSHGRLLPESFTDPPRGLRAGKARARVLQHRLLSRRIEREEALWITDEFSNGFFHWICDALPRLEALGPRGQPLLVVPAMAGFPYVVPSLEPYGLGEIRIMAWTERVCCRRIVRVPETAPTGNPRPSLVQGLRRRFQEHFNVRPGARRLYVSRRRAPARRISNEQDVTDLLARFGFEPVVIEEMTFPEQVRLMGSASVLLGNHGAGLTNMCWMAPGTTVFELRRRGDRVNNCYYALAAALGIGYRYLCCAAADERRPTHVADLVVDTRELERELEVIA